MGVDEQTLSKMSKEDIIASATESCSLADPGSCDMCSG